MVCDILCSQEVMRQKKRVVQKEQKIPRQTIRQGVLTEHTLSKPSQLEVGVVEGGVPLLRHILLFARVDDGGAAVQDALGGALHHQQIALLALNLVDGNLATNRRK